MFKFIKDEIELLTGSEPNDKSMYIKFLGILGLAACMIISIYRTALELIYTNIIKTEMVYSFTNESFCSAPPSAEVVLFGLFGLLLICSGILAMIEHYEDEDNVNKTSK